MRCMTGHAAFGLERRVLVSERPLLVGVTFYARRVCAGRQPCLLEFEAAMRIVAIAALHRAFEHLVMKPFVEVGLNFVVTTYAELRLPCFQQQTSREIGFFGVGSTHVSDRLRDVSSAGKRVC